MNAWLELSNPGELTVGIDFAADPKKTAVVAVRWSDGMARVEYASKDMTDRDVLGWMRAGAAKVGIDCPFGWPRNFVDLVSGHADGTHQFAGDQADGWRRGYYFRATDTFVAKTWGVRPLSVAADRIAHPAIRLSYLFHQLHEHHLRPSLDGSGVLAEVYPAAALKQWGLARAGYKKSPELRQEIVDEARARLAIEFAPGLEERVVGSDDVADALVCAWVARAIDRDLTERPGDLHQADALVEGWIHVPDAGSLQLLVP